MSIDFEAKSVEIPRINWVALKMGQIDIESVADDLKYYDLSVEDVQTLSKYELDHHLGRYGVNYLVDEAEYKAEKAREERLYNRGYTDAEMKERFEWTMKYGYTPSESSSDYGFDY